MAAAKSSASTRFQIVDAFAALPDEVHRHADVPARMADEDAAARRAVKLGHHEPSQVTPARLPEYLHLVQRILPGWSHQGSAASHAGASGTTFSMTRMIFVELAHQFVAVPQAARWYRMRSTGRRRRPSARSTASKARPWHAASDNPAVF